MNCIQNNCTCANQSGNLVYLTKVFYDAEENSSPILTTLTTSSEGFTQQLSTGSTCGNQSWNCSCDTGCSSGCGCDICRNICCCCGNDSCSNLTVSASTTFDVTNAYVVTRSFDLTNPTLPADLAITVDGTAITDVTESGGQYIGDISGIMSQITKCPCKSPCSGNCPGHFVMVSATGPWSLSAAIVIEGTVRNGGNTCQFRLCFNTVDGTPISVTGNSSFALCGVDIPCQAAGVAPSMMFDFDACASVLNPVLTGGANGTVTLNCSLVVTPQVRLRVTRPSLFDLNAREVAMPCDDLGQCNACDPSEAFCLRSSENDCCCGHPTVNRVNEILNSNNTDNTHSAATGCCSCGCGGYGEQQRQDTREITCQCCDTNGYSF